MGRRLMVAAALVVASVGAPVPAEATGDRCPQWRAAALAAGWTPAQWRTLDRIMWRESKCRPKAYNGRHRDRSFGLLQINTKGYLWAGHQGVRDLCGARVHRPSDLFQPTLNLWCAKQLHRKYGGRILWRVGF